MEQNIQHAEQVPQSNKGKTPAEDFKYAGKWIRAIGIATFSLSIISLIAFIPAVEFESLLWGLGVLALNLAVIVIPYPFETSFNPLVISLSMAVVGLVFIIISGFIQKNNKNASIVYILLSGFLILFSALNSDSLNFFMVSYLVVGVPLFFLFKNFWKVVR